MEWGKQDRHMQKNKIERCFTPNTVTNSKWIEDICVRPQSIKLLEDNIKGKTLDIGLSNDFFLI